MQDRSYPRYSIKNLVIWREEVAVMRVADKLECVTMPREEAFELLARIGTHLFTKEWSRTRGDGTSALLHLPRPTPEGEGGAKEREPRAADPVVMRASLTRPFPRERATLLRPLGHPNG